MAMPVGGTFTRFSRERLDELLRLSPVTAAGRQYIENALRAPSRNVQGGTRNLVGDHPCPKMGANSQFESGGTEHPVVLEHIFNADVLGYVTQPPQIGLDYVGRGGRRVRTSYTPDCLVFHLELGVMLEECKPASDRDKLEDKWPGKYARADDGSWSAGPIARAAEDLGFRFRLRFSDEIDAVSHENRKNLKTFLYPEADAIYAPHLDGLLKALRGTGAVSYQELIAQGLNIDALNWALAQGVLHADFSSASFRSNPEALLIFRDQPSLLAWREAVAPDGSRPSAVTALTRDELNANDVILVDGIRLVIQVPGASGIFAVDSAGNPVFLDFALLEQLRRSHKLVLPERPHSTVRASQFWRCSDVALTRALRMHQILKKHEEHIPLSREERYSDSTFRRLRSKIAAGRTQGISAIESIMDHIADRGYRGPHIDSTFSARLNEKILEKLGDPLNPKMYSMYFEIKAELEDEGYMQKMISLPSFYERVKKSRRIEDIRKSQGHKNAYQMEPVYWMLDQCTPVHCQRFLELVHFDSTLLDIELHSFMTGEVLGRAWLSIAVCAYTRRVVGMHLSYRPPSYESSMMLLADMIKRFGRIPDAIIHDWGSEFRAKDFKDALTALEIIRFVRPKSAPRFGAVLERMFGTVTTELIANLAGNTKLRKNVRTLSREVDPSTHSGLWLEDLYEALEVYFFDHYANRRHPTTLRSPATMTEQSLLQHGMQLHRVRRYEDVLPRLMPRAKGRARVLDTSRGIYVNYGHYGHTLLANLSLTGTDVPVRVIPFDPGSVLAFVRTEWVICHSPFYRKLESESEVRRRCLFEEWRFEKCIVSGEKNARRAKVRELASKLNQKALDNKEYWRDRDSRDFLNPAAIFNIPVKQPVLQSIGVLEQMMEEACRRVKPPSGDYIVVGGDKND